MAKGTPYKKGRKRCIFCADFNVTKEHILPDWLSQEKAAPGDLYTCKALQIDRTPEGIKLKSRSSTRPGNLGDRQSRFICARCNNEWLSGLETQAKSLILPLSRGEAATLYEDDQRVLATWIVKTVMTNEFHSSGFVSIAQEDRTLLRERNEPPPGWVVAIGTYGGSKLHMSLCSYYASLVASTIEIDGVETKVVHSDAVPPNVQSTIFAISHLLMYAASSAFSELTFNPTPHDDRGLYHIWPPLHHSINWPTAPTLYEVKARRLMKAVYHNLTSAGVGLPPFPNPF